ncbi:MAG: LysE family transporter [Candidatus Peribacteria bacterium]|nr:MAG: LysE family transporter [Candidatus Peribacteria bacterium]
MGNVLNPKATVYFLSLFTFVISPDVPLIILVIISALMVCIMFVWFSLVALFFTHEKVLKVFKRGEKYFNRLFGFLLVLLGIKVATSSVS